MDMGNNNQLRLTSQSNIQVQDSVSLTTRSSLKTSLTNRYKRETARNSTITQSQ